MEFDTDTYGLQMICPIDFVIDFSSSATMRVTFVIFEWNVLTTIGLTATKLRTDL